MKPLKGAAACAMKWLVTGNMAGVSEVGIGSADANAQAAQCLQLCWLEGASDGSAWWQSAIMPSAMVIGSAMA